MFRRSPTWYFRHYDVVMCAFEDVFGQPIPQLHVLPAFANAKMAPDGIHYDPLSGSRYYFIIIVIFC